MRPSAPESYVPLTHEGHSPHHGLTRPEVDQAVEVVRESLCAAQQHCEQGPLRVESVLGLVQHD